MFTFLLIVQTIIAASLVAVILMQRSEGGGLGVGGSSSGFMTARGAADFLTRTTAILAGIFVTLSIVLAAIAGVSREPTRVDTSLANQAAPAAPTGTGLPPLAPGTTAPAQNQTQPAENQAAPAVPLAQ
ncbi:MAG TPA: preprotein translocase subunit SecG [Sphingomicrobium sp.]|nr:preprotein translocase subunit SecG [Sphingomicrobium sp.]